jgi:hypothetical protein
LGSSVLHSRRRRIPVHATGRIALQTAEGPYFSFGVSQASVTALSMMCRSTLLHRGQPNVRKSWPKELGSIAVNRIGELQVEHCGPWFWTSSIGFPSPSAGALPNSRSPIVAVVVR